MNAVSVKGSVFAAEGPVFSAHLFRKASRRGPGKFLHMDFINHLLRTGFRRFVLFPALRIRPAEIHRHAPFPVDSAGPRIHICRNSGFPVYLKGKIVIYSMQIPAFPILPDALLQPFHLMNRQGVPFASVPVKSDPGLFRKGTPDAENALPENVFRAVIKKSQPSVVKIVSVKIRIVIKLFPFQSRSFHSLFLFCQNTFSENPERRAAPEKMPCGDFLSGCAAVWRVTPLVIHSIFKSLRSAQTWLRMNRQPFTAPDTPST